MFLDQLTQLVFRHNVDKFTVGQIQTIWAFHDRQVEKHLMLDRVEAAILDEDNKQLYFMCGLIKREYPKDCTLTWSSDEAAAKCYCSKKNVKPIMTNLEKLGAITLLQEGKPGKHSNRAALYRREV